MNMKRNMSEARMSFKSQKRKKQREIAYIISSSANQKTSCKTNKLML